ncbi:MAG: hypothetical protein B6I20_01020 [Bacteroidetes bacterium 4572_117]|nr:MAG: hypothetical protein B6I20_01020 [Bacteroidetes bacterium 4572_117]
MVFLAIVNFIKKYWFIFLLIVVYILIAGLNILPRGLNIFKKHRLLIDETPVVVKEIKEIGELSTAEFYGEVYADLNEVYSELLVKYEDSLRYNPSSFYEKYPGLKEYRKENHSFRSEEIIFEKESESYELFISQYYKKIENYRKKEVELKKHIGSAVSKSEKKKIEKRLDDLLEKTKDEQRAYISKKEKFNGKEKSYRKAKSDYRKKRKKRNLVYIGRGWVKAGINLNNLSDKEIFIDDSDSLYIHILIPEPSILDVDINPWFIHTRKKKIKGFELFIAKTNSALTKANFTHFEVNAVKHKCKIKLEQDALEKGLLKAAKKSAITTLENFFHLLGFEKVKINFKTKDYELISNN